MVEEDRVIAVGEGSLLWIKLAAGCCWCCSSICGWRRRKKTAIWKKKKKGLGKNRIKMKKKEKVGEWEKKRSFYICVAHTPNTCPMATRWATDENEKQESATKRNRVGFAVLSRPMGSNMMQREKRKKKVISHYSITCPFKKKRQRLE